MAWAQRFEDFGPQAHWQGVGKGAQAAGGSGVDQSRGGAYGGLMSTADSVATNIADLSAGIIVPVCAVGLHHVFMNQY